MSFLSDLSPGEAAYIENTPPSGSKSRLIEFGIVGGTRVECIADAPFGGASAYLIRGAVVALRHSDAREILVQRIPHASRMALGIGRARLRRWD